MQRIHGHIGLVKDFKNTPSIIGKKSSKRTDPNNFRDVSNSNAYEVLMPRTISMWPELYQRFNAKGLNL